MEHQKKRTIKDKLDDNVQEIIVVLSILLALIFIVNTIMLFWNPSTKIEKPKPVNIELTVISSDCKDCFDITNIVNSIKSGNVNIKKEQSLASDKANDLINKYKINKLPTVIVKGEIEKLNLEGFEKKEDALVFTSLKPPYFSIKENKVLGLVSLTQINAKSCTQCESLDPLVKQFTISKIKIVDKKVLDVSDSSAKDLIKKYGITKVPTIVISKDLSAYEEVVGQWSSIGSVENDGTYILREAAPPYLDLTTNKVKGLVSVVYVNDSSCKECYNVIDHKTILARMGIKVVNEKVVDINTPEGMKVVDSYTITKAPTIILSKETEDYSFMKQLWAQVGSIEKNGDYVFRSVEVMGKYKDLTTNKEIEPPKQTAPAQ